MNVQTSVVGVEIEQGVMSVVLQRPEALNAYSEEMLDGLVQAMEEAARNTEVKVVIVSGAGRAFCAGGDVKSMGDFTPLTIHEFVGKLNYLVRSMSQLEKPIIAAVHGYAAGAGICLALACDLIISAEDTKFSAGFAQIGLVADGGGMFFLPRSLGTYRAKEMLFTGKVLSAAKAQEWGIVNEIYPSDQLMEEAKNLALRLTHGPSRTYAMVKKLANQALTADLEAMLEMERNAQTVMASTADHKEGVQAFKEKRKPEFTGE
ncbi:enoyl-CoA hydratase/isomerase family protein [Aneurinibacillus sp. REN35]|uniref:enoyl-CoA hydratase/isomerase family protein n=1 Tax=Aneurinibacillus sp. REN35 TaxID=3237286 RepID=UPI00352972DC